MEKLKQINLNQYIYVKIKEKGWEHWLQKINEGLLPSMRMSMDKLKSTRLQPDGFCQMQIHDFVFYFGCEFFIDKYVHMNVCFEEKDLEDYVPETKESDGK